MQISYEMVSNECAPADCVPLNRGPLNSSLDASEIEDYYKSVVSD